MLPTDDQARKALPVFTGPVMYFPDVMLALAAVCQAGNDQHNPGEPLHWAREKSTDQLNTAMRHLMDHGLGVAKDTDGQWHLAKAIWRLCAELQLTIEKFADAEAIVEAPAEAPEAPAYYPAAQRQAEADARLARVTHVQHAYAAGHNAGHQDKEWGPR